MSDDNRAHLLIVDDEVEIRDVLAQALSASHRCVAVPSAEEALLLLSTESFDVVLSDISLGHMSGLQLVPQILRMAPETVIIMISGAQTMESAIEALRAGAFDYIMKPFDLGKIECAVWRALDHRALLQARRCYETYLEELIEQRTAELNQTLDTLEESQRTTLEALVAVLETRDAETYGHSERVVTFSSRLGRELGLETDELRALEFGALLHDIGKIGIPDSILRKPAQLSDGEWEAMRAHPTVGQKILAGIGFLGGAARVVGEHHEKWDGTGYPSGLIGDEIDFKARIFAVVDAFDAMISDRVYRGGKSYQFAAAELDRCAGQQFDPQVVAAFHRVPQEDWRHLQDRSLFDLSRKATLGTNIAKLRTDAVSLSESEVTRDWIKKLQEVVYTNRGHLPTHSGW